MVAFVRALVVAFGTLVFAATVASAGPVVGRGATGTCLITGALTLKPLWVAGGTVTPTAATLTGKLGKKGWECSGGTVDGESVLFGTIKGVIASNDTNNCSSVVMHGLPAFSAFVTWKVEKGFPKLWPSVIKFAPTPPTAVNTAGPHGSLRITMTGTGAAKDAKGRPTSFAGNAFTVVLVTDETLADYFTACTRGLKALHFRSVNGQSTLGS